MPRRSLLARQLKRLGLDEAQPPSLEGWQALLETINRSYAETEQDRYTLERSLSISSREMRELYDELKHSSESQLALERDKLSQSVAIHEAVLEVAVDGVLVVDRDRRVVSYNRRFVELWGIPGDVLATHDDDRMLGVVLAKLAHPDEFIERVRHLYEHPIETSFDEIELRDGRSLERHSAPVVLASGEPIGRVWFFHDITSRRHDERKLRETNWFLDSIVENIPNMVFVKDATDLHFVRFNRAGEQLLGWQREDLIGKSDADFFPAEQAAHFNAYDRRVLAQDGVVTVDEQVQTRANGVRDLTTKKIPIRDQAGRPAYLLGISEDITEQRLRQAELLTAKEAAEKASRIKSDFLLNMNHELRTPLNAILGFARVLSRGARAQLDADQVEYLQHIVQASEHMLQLVNDLLDLRSLEEKAVAPAKVAVAEAIEDSLDLVRSLIEEKCLNLAVEPVGAQVQVLADKRAVTQVLINLLSNAAKFTPAGGAIRVSAAQRERWVEISVGDTGIGIAPADQVKLFTYFEQVGAKHAHQMKGSGVGLALTRALVEKFGGTIAVDSMVNVGSTFRFCLPAAS